MVWTARESSDQERRYKYVRNCESLQEWGKGDSLSHNELRGIAEYYTLADNFTKALWRLQHLWFQSWLKTLAHKHDTSVQKMLDTFNRGSYYAVRVKGKQGEEKEIKASRRNNVPFHSACIFALVPEHFPSSITPCLQHLAA